MHEPILAAGDEDPPLSPDIIKSIPWDISDELYARAKIDAFERAKQCGLELADPRGQPLAGNYDVALQQGTQSCLALLRQKAELDIAVVVLGAGANRPEFHRHLDSRLNEEDLDLLDALRSALTRLAEHISPFVLARIMQRRLADVAQIIDLA